ncbi:hypothetical protein B7L68_00920 [Thermoproteus sp. CP80]|uniref:hypothetical protein n=1 Tax=Thermoproteus sp. CP80 TaxID=1650659 RepID=UPI0009C05517|nr:hypothetical protein [Thermoproteus sp. CP80]PLC67101.1 hypothetical protein B7L68_00920 [Thermoproteus sp. CP80]
MHGVVGDSGGITEDAVHRGLDVVLAVVIAAAIMVAILSMPEVLEPVAKAILSSLGFVLPAAMRAGRLSLLILGFFLIGLGIYTYFS